MSTPTVPRPREVFGPARRLKDWWAADQVGKEVTIVQAFWVRRLPRNGHRLPGVVARGLARRGLLERERAQSVDLTDAGRELKRLLGSLPEHLLEERWRAQPADVRARYPHVDSLTYGPLLTEVTCTSCGREVAAELIAWDLYDYAPDVGERTECIRCATGRPARVAEERTNT